ncbi:hypothetical protein SteCoe_26818 [Stentor coeruleus]|uniref:Uncharacterized protein n=1 Tax=Stentor coeruleus TaxID=5963 RepID=A0A1R2BC00_9CILI|nr:hypothetical protein SteCoe_26818 [Stentor coeruleus]
MSSKITKKTKTDKFEPKIGFENPNNNEMSLSFSEFEIEGQPPRSESFFSESDNQKEESKSNNVIISDVNEGANESQGLNHAFFEENSESATEKEVSDFFKQEIENTAVAKREKKTKGHAKSISETSEPIEIIISNAESIEKSKAKEKTHEDKDVKNKEKEKIKKQEQSASICCKCKGCLIF